MSQTYGLTEACSQVATQTPGDPAPAAGPPLFCTRVAIAPDGEILVSGPTVSPAVADGVLATGDLGELVADGSLAGASAARPTRSSRGGENVAPTRGRGGARGAPGGRSRPAVFGVADPHWGEAVHALVVARARGQREPSCARTAPQRLAAYKVPKAIAFADALPRTAVGQAHAAASRLTLAHEAVGSRDARPRR